MQVQVAGSGQAGHAVVVWGTVHSGRRLGGRTAGFMPSGRAPPSLLSLPAAAFPLGSALLEWSAFFSAAGFLALSFLSSADVPLSAVPLGAPALALLVAGAALWLCLVAASESAAIDARVFRLLAVEAAIETLSPAALFVVCPALRFCVHSQTPCRMRMRHRR